MLTYDSGLSHQLAHQTDETGLSLLSLAALGGEGVVCVRSVLLVTLYPHPGNKDMAEWLLEGYPDLANVANSNGNLPVHFAAAQGMSLWRSIMKCVVSAVLNCTPCTMTCVLSVHLNCTMTFVQGNYR